MKKTLQLYNLDYSKTLLYIQDNFPWAHTLSTEMLKIIESVKGSFFTYVYSPVELENIHQFRCSINNRVIKIKDVSLFIWKYINKDNTFVCMLEDILKSPGEHHLEVFEECGFLYEKEIYYQVSQNNLSIDLIMDCLDESSCAMWHSLCVLTHFNECKTKTGFLTLEMIKQICQQTEIAIIGAYDTEGYIFWKRENDHANIK